MLLDPGPLGLHSAIAEPFLSAITAMVAIIWKAGFSPLFKDQPGDATAVFSAPNFNAIGLFSPGKKLPSLTLTGLFHYSCYFPSE